jgi:hypothetical protein
MVGISLGTALPLVSCSNSDNNIITFTDKQRALDFIHLTCDAALTGADENKD